MCVMVCVSTIFFFTFSSFPPLASPAFLLRPFLPLLELADGPAERIAVDPLVSHPRFLSPSRLKRRRVSPPSRIIIRRFQVGRCNSFRAAARRRGSSSIARVSRKCADDASVEAGRLLFFFFFFPRFFRRVA